MKAFQDGSGKRSSFRIVWAVSALAIVGTWSLANIKSPGSMPWPMDGITTLGFFGVSAAKTFSENRKPPGD